MAATILQGFGYMWVTVIVAIILISFGRIWLVEGFQTALQVMSPFNPFNWILVGMALIPGIAALRVAQNLKPRQEMDKM